MQKHSTFTKEKRKQKKEYTQMECREKRGGGERDGKINGDKGKKRNAKERRQKHQLGISKREAGA